MKTKEKIELLKTQKIEKEYAMKKYRPFTKLIEL